MAKPLEKITKTSFLNNYNIVVVLTNKTDIMKCLETFNPKNQAVALGFKKMHTLSTDEKIDLIIKRLDQYDQLFKEHGWIK
ncbi:MAG: hypothetical protein ACOQNY_01705 [Mycoplasmoidaceae bacterium]